MTAGKSPTRNAAGLVIVATTFIPKPLDGGDARFEIETVNAFDWSETGEAVKPVEARKRLKRTAYLTRDEQLFDQANEFIDGPPVALAWQQGKRKNGETCKVVTAITRDPNPPRLTATALAKEVVSA